MRPNTGATERPPPGPTSPAAAPVKDRHWDTDLALESISNLPSDMADQVAGMVDAIGKTVTTKQGAIDTAKNIAKLAATVPSEIIARTGLPVPSLRKVADNITPYLSPEKAAKVKELITSLYAPQDAIVKDYKEAYGTDEARKKTIAEHPARVLMDLATVLTGGEGALAKAPQILGTVGKAGRVGEVLAKTGEVMGNTAKVIDPVSGTLALGTKVAPMVSDFMTGSGSGVMREAGRTGYVGGEAGEGFRAGMAGKVDPREFVDKAKGGLDTMKQRMYTEFANDKDVWDKVNGKLGFTGLDNAQANISKGMYSQAGTMKRIVPEAAENQITGLFEIVKQWKNDPASHTVAGFDELKRTLRNNVDWGSTSPGSKVVKQAATELANAAQKEVIAAAKGTPYEKAMKAYGDMADTVHEIESAFSLGDKASTQTAMSKLQSTMRNNASTQYGLRKNLMETLRDESGVDLFPELAGQAASSWRARGLAGAIQSGTIPGGAALWGAAGGIGPLLGAGAALAASSPKLMAGIYHNIGRAAGAPGAAAERMFGRLGRPMVEGALSQPTRTGLRLKNMVDQADEQGPQSTAGLPPGIDPASSMLLGRGRARGGRVGYADGGEVLLQPQATPALARLPLAGGRVSLGANYDPTSRYGVVEGGYDHPIGPNVLLGLQGHYGKDLGPEGASARPNWGIGLRGRVRFADGGDVDTLDLPSLSAMRGANYFTPSITLNQQRGAPSQPVIAPMADAKLPTMDVKPANTWGDLAKEGVKAYEDYTKKGDEKEQKRKNDAIIMNLRAAAAGAPTLDSPMKVRIDPNDPTDPGGGAVAASPATPLSGDSYEAKVGNLESGGKDDAVNASTGTAGRYQFSPTTAEAIRKAHPELQISDSWRTNVDDQKKLMKQFTDENRAILRQHLGREPTGGELYAAHFYGPAGAVRFLSSLNKPITQATTDDERKYNPHLYQFKTGQDWLDYHNRRFA